MHYKITVNFTYINNDTAIFCGDLQKSAVFAEFFRIAAPVRFTPTSLHIVFPCQCTTRSKRTLMPIYQSRWEWRGQEGASLSDALPATRGSLVVWGWRTASDPFGFPIARDTLVFGSSSSGEASEEGFEYLLAMCAAGHT
jgi:hypothetical protein